MSRTIDGLNLIMPSNYNQSLVPLSNNTYDIGTNSLKWKDLYLAGVGYLSTLNNGGNLTLPSSSDTLVGRETTDTLTNKTLVTNSLILTEESSGNQINFFPASSSGQRGLVITLATSITADATFTFPSASDTLVGRVSVDTLTNKTLSSPIFSGSSATGTLHFSSGGLILPTSGGTGSTINYYEEGTENITFSGPWSTGSKTVTVSFVKLNHALFMTWPDMYGTSNSAVKITATISTLRWRPASNQNYLLTGEDNGGNTMVWMSIQTNGNITVGVGSSQNSYTNTGQAALWSGFVSYLTV